VFLNRRKKLARACTNVLEVFESAIAAIDDGSAAKVALAGDAPWSSSQWVDESVASTRSSTRRAREEEMDDDDDDDDDDNDDSKRARRERGRQSNCALPKDSVQVLKG
jgi:hypothetical protein